METILLTPDEENVLESVYGRQTANGYNPNKLEAIKDLDTQEKKFFARGNFVSPHFFIQTLYKIRGNVTIMKFSVAVRAPSKSFARKAPSNPK